MKRNIILPGIFCWMLISNCQVRDGKDFPPEAPKAFEGVVVFSGAAALAVTENGSDASFTANLTKAPLGTLKISLGSASGQLTITPSTISFTPGNWQLLQPITIAAVDDAVVQGTRIVIVKPVVTSDDPEFLNVVFSDIPVTISDNDIGGIGVTVSGGATTISEDGLTDQFFVQLSATPLQDVTVFIDNPNPSRIIITPPSFNFTPATWGATLTVNVSAVNDAIAQGNTVETISVRTVSTQNAFNNLAAPVATNLIDND